MLSRNFTIKVLVVLTVLAVAGASVFVGTSLIRPKGARAATTSLMTLDPTSLSATLVSQSTYSGQDVETNWSLPNGDSVTVAGPQGSVLNIQPISWTGDPGTTVAPEIITVSPPPPSTTAITGDQAISLYAASGFSLYHDAMAVGFSSAEASQMINEDAASSSRIFSHICANDQWKGHYTSHECVYQVLLQSSGSKDWYIANKTRSSETAVGHNALEEFATWVSHAGHDNIDWDPSATITKGSCSTVTLNVGYNGSGVSVSQDVCPQTLNPRFGDWNGFGAKWTDTNGDCPGTWETNPSASVEYDAGGSNTDNYTLWDFGGVYFNYC